MPEAGAGSDPSRWIALAGLATAAAVIFFVIVSSLGGSDDSSDTSTVDFDDLPTSSRFVLYEVGGTATAASITMSTPTGTQQSNVDVPLRVATGPRAGQDGLRIGPFARGEFVYISAQNDGFGTISCRITTDDGELISSNQSSGRFSIVTCRGRMP
jgi:hypothetical protein